MTYLLLISLVVAMLLAGSSSWRKSVAGYVGVVLATSIFICSFFVESMLASYRNSEMSSFFLDVGAVLVGVGLTWVFFTMKYLTNTSFFNISYQSMSKFKEYVDKKGYRTPYESFTIIGGYVVFFYSIFFFAIYVYMDR